MDIKKLAEQAAIECASAETTAHHGGSMGRGFWNAESIQFMYVPAFQFAPIPECRRYLYEAVDEQGNVHAFEGKTSHELMSPISSKNKVPPSASSKSPLRVLMAEVKEPFS